MRDPVPTPRNAGESRTSTGFFLGIASLLLFIIGLSMSITFCYFRKNLRLLCLSALNASELDIKPKAMSEAKDPIFGLKFTIILVVDHIDDMFHEAIFDMPDEAINAASHQSLGDLIVSRVIRQRARLMFLVGLLVMGLGLYVPSRLLCGLVWTYIGFGSNSNL
ncbi:hypothetical protein CRG98_032001 [Punica granatum]|nr:hypothetical protein CRG98_032001 [Punica granatum]